MVIHQNGRNVTLSEYPESLPLNTLDNQSKINYSHSMSKRIVSWGFVLALLALSLVEVARAEESPRGDGLQYMELRLSTIPTARQRAELQAKGIRLGDYLSRQTYGAWLRPGALTTLHHVADGAGGKVYQLEARTRGRDALALAQKPRDWQEKLAPGMSHEAPKHAQANDGRLRLSVHVLDGFEESAMRAYWTGIGVEVEHYSVPFRRFVLLASRDAIEGIASPAFVRTVDWVEAPNQLFDSKTRAMLGVPSVEPSPSNGYNLSGRGVRVGIFDSDVYPHPDFGNRLHVVEHKNVGDHGQHVAGIVGGSGLLNPDGQGVAPKAELYTWNYTGWVVEKMEEAEKTYGIVVSQNSYGAPMRGSIGTNFCQNRKRLKYNMDNIDALALSAPELLQVYAAGNSQADCLGSPGDLGGYGTITRQAKNIIQVGAVDAQGRMTRFSSWGPLADGRLAPHVCTNGSQIFSTGYSNGYVIKSGTSQACPAISGLAALLSELYSKQNPGQHPKSILLKGLILNGAKDAGRPGPDYQYGYGIANAERSARMLNQGQYAFQTIQHGQEATHRITVPEGLSRLKVMMVYMDRYGTEGDRDLINDLDLTVLAPGGEAKLPLTLNP